jgi:hypothetical protein
VSWGQPGAFGQPATGYGEWPPAPRRTSGFAIAALVTSILALLPLALALVIAAVVRMRRRDERGWGLLYGALSVTLAWTTLVCLLLGVGLSGGFDYDSRGGLAQVASTEVGTCLQEDPAEVADCSTDHDLEVYFSPTIPDPVWPGAGDLASYADTLCDEAFAGYVGTSYTSSDYDYDYYAPTKAEWQSGKHTVVCVITPAGDYLNGSVKGSGD